jgi:hypothetical protein
MADRLLRILRIKPFSSALACSCMLEVRRAAARCGDGVDQDFHLARQFRPKAEFLKFLGDVLAGVNRDPSGRASLLRLRSNPQR